MKNKKICRTCKWRGFIYGFGSNVMHCRWSEHHHESCLKRGPKGTTTDVRGDDPNVCPLYEQGDMKKLKE